MLKKTMKSVLAGSALLLGLAFAGSASSGVIYNGANFSLSLESSSQIGTNYIYNFKYTANFANWGAIYKPNQDFIAAVNFKPNTGLQPTLLELTSTTASGTWSIENGNATNRGCEGGADNFVCSRVNPVTSAPTTGNPAPIYNWLFKLTYAQALTSSAFKDAPIRAWFVDGNGLGSNGIGAGLMSLKTDIDGGGGTQGVPEPASLGLLGLGLLAMGAIRRRKVALKR